MLSKNEKDFLGRGWSFPPVFDPTNGQVAMVSEEEDIRQSLRIILSTLPGERVMQPLFGCNIQRMVFKPIHANTISMIKDMVATSILNFEPRIEVEQILVTQNAEELSRVDIDISYFIRTINIRTNMVYPFYFLEGTDIKEQQSL